MVIRFPIPNISYIPGMKHTRKHFPPFLLAVQSISYKIHLENHKAVKHFKIIQPIPINDKVKVLRRNWVTDAI